MRGKDVKMFEPIYIAYFYHKMFKILAYSHMQ